MGGTPISLTSDIVRERFALLRPRFDIEMKVAMPSAEDLGLPKAELDPERALERFVADIKSLLGSSSGPIGGYEWATDPTLYRDYMEAMMQHDFLKVLSEVSPDHPDLRRLSPVSIKWVANPYYASVCVPDPTVSFICLSRGFAKFLQVVVGTMIRLHDMAETCPPHDSKRTNYLLGADMERALIHDSEEARYALHVLIGSAMRSMEGEMVGMDQPQVKRLLELAPRHPILAAIYTSCEVFIVLHEVGHLMRGHDSSRGRNLEDELAADRAGQSLLIIADAVLKYPGSFIAGPAFFFQVSRIYELARRVLRRDPDETPEQELQVRLRATIERAPQMGVPLSPMIRALAAEMSVLLAGCQRELLRLARGQGLQNADLPRTEGDKPRS